jgi:hypothetical protein
MGNVGFRTRVSNVSGSVFRLSFSAYTGRARHMHTTNLLALSPLPPQVASVAPGTALGFPELVHLGDSLLELDVLALLVAVSLVLRKSRVSLSPLVQNARSIFRRIAAVRPGIRDAKPYLALPRHVVCFEAAPVEGDQKMATAVSVC